MTNLKPLETEILALHSLGHTLGQICRSTGASPELVRQTIERDGIRLPLIHISPSGFHSPISDVD